MFGRFGWAEILIIVVLLVILFGSSKIPGMMKNLADGLNVFKKEIKNQDKNVNASAPKTTVAVKNKSAKKAVTKAPAVKKSAVKRPATKKPAKKNAVKK